MRAPTKPVLVAVAVAVAVLALGGVAWALVAAAGDEPGSVQEVADAAVDAAEDLDVDAGVRLLCDPPTAQDRAELEDLIDEGRDRAGTEDPEVDYVVSDVRGEGAGSFDVEITSPEPGLEDRSIVLEVVVRSDGDRSCIDDAEAVEPDGS